MEEDSRTREEKRGKVISSKKASGMQAFYALSTPPKSSTPFLPN